MVSGVSFSGSNEIEMRRVVRARSGCCLSRARTRWKTALASGQPLTSEASGIDEAQQHDTIPHQIEQVHGGCILSQHPAIDGAHDRRQPIGPGSGGLVGQYPPAGSEDLRLRLVGRYGLAHYGRGEQQERAGRLDQLHHAEFESHAGHLEHQKNRPGFQGGFRSFHNVGSKAACALRITEPPRPGRVSPGARLPYRAYAPKRIWCERPRPSL